MINLLIFGFFTYLNIVAIISYNKNYSVDVEVKYIVYTQNLWVIALLIYSFGVICYEAWILIDTFILNNNVLSLQDSLSIITFILKILLYIQMITLFISCIIILSRKSVIADNKIITGYGVFQFTELNSIELINENIIQYELKPKPVLAIFPIKKIKTKEANGNEILEYIKGKM